jgi:hypothetical protein
VGEGVSFIKSALSGGEELEIRNEELEMRN